MDFFLFLEGLVLVEEVIGDISFLIFFGVVMCRFVESVLDGEIAAGFEEDLAHFEVAFPGRVEEGGLSGNFIDVIGVG